MANRIIPLGFIILFMLLPFPAAAMQFDPCSIAEITTDPCHQVGGWLGSFAVSGNVAVWIDQRDPDWIPRIYGVNLDDPCHAEFIIDSNAPNCSRVAMSGTRVVYYVIPADNSGLFFRVADITNQSSPSFLSFYPLMDNIGYFDISGTEVTYAGDDPNNSYLETIYLADISAPPSVSQYVINVLPTDHHAYGLSIDVNHLAWSANFYDPNPYVQVADITNPTSPSTATLMLPTGISFGEIDISGDFLVAYGWDSGRNSIFGIRKYKDVNDCNIVRIWQEGNGEYYLSGPRLDNSIAVWTVTTRPPSFKGGNGPLGVTEFLIKGSHLLQNGVCTLSTLRQSTNSINGADISGRQVVWSQWSDVADLMKGTIVFQCGDWGYKYGDLNRDCKVDLYDFAIFAEDWLTCTMPDEPNCELGKIQ
jgi:hypothetical protein